MTTAIETLRFRVVVGGLEVGRFSHCSGLGFEYDILEYQEGGENAFTHALRGPVRRATLTLSRGMTDETALLDWFFGTRDGSSHRTVTVFLLDERSRELRHWAFEGGLPVRWTGPALDAASGGVAVETLEITHQGLVATIPRSAMATGALAPSFQHARLEIEGGGEIACWLNPREYTITGRNAWEQAEPNHSGPLRVRFAGGVTHELGVELMFDAADVEDRSVSDVCTALLAVLDPVEREPGDPTGFARPPILTFAWGQSAPFRAVARDITIRYLLFRADGEPLRALVGLTLVQAEAARSALRERARGALGGGVGRPSGAFEAQTVHMVTLGETLPVIAHRRYGSPYAWRVIADANDLADPTRLVPGTALTLPLRGLAADEVALHEERADEPVPPVRGVRAGVAFPLQVDRAGAIRLSRGVEGVEEAMRLILGTEPGERPMRPDFGCALHQFIFERPDASTLGRIRQEVLGALDRWEPRIEVLDVRVGGPDPISGIIDVDVTYALSGGRATRRMVHPVAIVPTEEAPNAA